MTDRTLQSQLRCLACLHQLLDCQPPPERVYTAIPRPHALVLLGCECYGRSRSMRVLNVLKEPPFRRLAKLLVQMLPWSVSSKALWDAAERPQYLFGLLHAAEQARREGHRAVSVLEFGVAEGYGLLSMQAHAVAAERHTAVQVHLYGFDSGAGLPPGKATTAITPMCGRPETIR